MSLAKRAASSTFAVSKDCLKGIPARNISSRKSRFTMHSFRNIILSALLCWLLPQARTHAQCNIQGSTVVTNALCFGDANGSIDLTVSNGTEPYTYLWSDNQNIQDPAGLAAGAYTCTVTDNVGCTAVFSAAIEQPAALQAILPSAPTLTCVVTSFVTEVVAQGGTPPYSYHWSNGAITQGTPISLPGQYFVTVTDAHNCTASNGITIYMDTNTPIATISTPTALDCNNPVVTLNGNGSSTGSAFFYSWSTPNGNFIGGIQTLTPSVDLPGYYFLMVTNAQNGCTSSASTTVLQSGSVPEANAGPNLTLSCPTGLQTLLGTGTSGPNIIYQWTGPGILSGGNTLNPIVNQAGTYTLSITDTLSACSVTSSVVINAINGGLCSWIEGNVLADTTANCQSDAGEPGMAYLSVKAAGLLDTFYSITDAAGHFRIDVATGDTYTVSAKPLNALWYLCAPVSNLAVNNPQEAVQAGDLMLQQVKDCPQLSVFLGSSNLRRCMTTTFSVQYCNFGTGAAEGAYVLLNFDPLFSQITATVPSSDQGNGVWRFDIGHVPINYCNSFQINAYLDCDAVLGQTFCTEAHIYPDSSCLPPDPQWSGASLELSSQCSTDSLRFRIQNVGSGNMTNALDYIVIEDQVMLYSNPVQLNAGESITVSVPANGSTWRVEVPQEPFHPGKSHPALSVEGCSASSNFTTGFVNMFYQDDEDLFSDIYCTMVVGSLDPNDKQAQPAGYGAEHYILPGTPLEYMIRFQNTGNDTAFRVRIEDTLSSLLDLETLQGGPSSHPYTMTLDGGGVLNFLFENILLPDSNVNEPASHGFVKYLIVPKVNAPLESRIENKADIYFDFNDPVATNTTYHRLGEHFLTVGTWEGRRPEYAVAVQPNPFGEQAELSISGLSDSRNLSLQLSDLQGNIVRTMHSDSGRFEILRANLPAGMYVFEVRQEGRLLGRGKLVMSR